MNYTDSYQDIEKTVQNCKIQHERFWTFLNNEERTTKPGLNNLLLQPVLRVAVYTDVVGKLLRSIPENHGMRKNIESAFEKWTALNEQVDLSARMQANDEKLISVELSFPYDRLELSHGTAEHQEETKRRWSVGRKMLGAGMYIKCKQNEVESEYAKCANMEWHIVFQMKISGPRWYIEEVDAFDGAEKDGRKRRLHVFHDLILVSKLRTKGTYNLRRRYKLTESWIGESPEMDTTMSLILGSPYHRKAKLSFSTLSKKQKFAESTRKLIHEALAAEPSEETNGQIEIFPYLTDDLAGSLVNDLPVFKSVPSTMQATSSDVILATLSMLEGPDSKNKDASMFVLYELTSHGMMLVNAWECPLMIKRVGSRCHLHRSRCQFILRRKSADALTLDQLPPALQCLVTHASTKAQRRMSATVTGSGATPHGRILTAAEELDQRNNERKRGIMKSITAGIGKRLGFGYHSHHHNVKKHVVANSPSPGTDPSKLGLLYRRPLEEIFTDGHLPQPLEHMISRLYFDGPSAQGLFRKSANARVCRQVREHLDEGKHVDFSELPILAVGAILKEFLRALPDSVMTLELYDEMVALNSIVDKAERIKQVGIVLGKMPESSRYLLGALMPVFVEICKAEEVNHMTASNVGICIGQSLMWPRTTEDILKNDVPPFIEFLILNYDPLFSGEGDHHVFEKLAHTDSNAPDSVYVEGKEADPKSGSPQP